MNLNSIATEHRGGSCDPLTCAASERIRRLAAHMFAALLLAACMLLAISAHTYAASGTECSGKVNSRSGLVLRSSPGTGSRAVTVLPDNTSLVIYKEVFRSKTSTARKYRWYYVKARGRKGYVRSDYVDSIKYGKVSARITRSANYRKGPGIRMKKKGTLSKGTKVTVYMDANPVNSVRGTSKLWYRVRIRGKYYYVCSTYVKLTGKAASAAPAASGTSSSGGSASKSSGSSTLTAEEQVSKAVAASGNSFSKMTTAQFETYLTNQGFPDAYKKKLRVLHEKHPNWVFSAYKTGLKWKDVLKKETALKVSLIYKSYPKSYRLASTANSQVEPGWYNASEEVVAYYMDPRNFINEDRIYMFEDLSYKSEYQTAAVINKVIGSTRLPSYGFTAQVFIKAGKKYNISPVFLAVRVVQETGGNSVSVNGSKSGGIVVYNPFNIGATGSNPAAQGLEYARKQGWTTPAKSVNGGAQYLASGYISKKQNSIYFQRFNVANGLSKAGTHQYMTNIMAPYSESHITKTSYSQLGITGEALGFIIPVYSSMPSQTKLP